jgi:hypothetical protein
MCTILVFIATLVSGVGAFLRGRKLSKKNQSEKIVECDRPGPADTAIKRWRIGHQVFSSIDQFLVLLLARLSVALSRQDYAQATLLFKQIGDLLEASAVALKYTGSFSDENAYSDIVVPSMESFAPQRMSGLNMKDHSEVVTSIRSLKLSEDARSAWPIQTQIAYGRFACALATAIDHHAFACEVMAGRRPPISKPAGPASNEVLRRINQKRKADGGCPRNR